MFISKSLLLFGVSLSLLSGCKTRQTEKAKVTSVEIGERYMGQGMVPMAIVKVDLTGGEHVGSEVECSMPESRGVRPFHISDSVSVQYSVLSDGGLNCIDIVR